MLYRKYLSLLSLSLLGIICDPVGAWAQKKENKRCEQSFNEFQAGLDLLREKQPADCKTPPFTGDIVSELKKRVGNLNPNLSEIYNCSSLQDIDDALIALAQDPEIKLTFMAKGLLEKTRDHLENLTSSFLENELKSHATLASHERARLEIFHAFTADPSLGKALQEKIGNVLIQNPNETLATQRARLTFSALTDYCSSKSNPLCDLWNEQLEELKKDGKEPVFKLTGGSDFYAESVPVQSSYLLGNVLGYLATASNESVRSQALSKAHSIVETSVLLHEDVGIHLENIKKDPSLTSTDIRDLRETLEKADLQSFYATYADYFDNDQSKQIINEKHFIKLQNTLDTVLETNKFAGNAESYLLAKLGAEDVDRLKKLAEIGKSYTPGCANPLWNEASSIKTLITCLTERGTIQAESDKWNQLFLAMKKRRDEIAQMPVAENEKPYWKALERLTEMSGNEVFTACFAGKNPTTEELTHFTCDKLEGVSTPDQLANDALSILSYSQKNSNLMQKGNYCNTLFPKEHAYAGQPIKDHAFASFCAVSEKNVVASQKVKEGELWNTSINRKTGAVSYYNSSSQFNKPNLAYGVLGGLTASPAFFNIFNMRNTFDQGVQNSIYTAFAVDAKYNTDQILNTNLDLTWGGDYADVSGFQFTS